MSAYGKITISESDDARYVVGHTYNVVLQGDSSYNEAPVREGVPEAEAEATDPPNGADTATSGGSTAPLGT